MNRLKHRLHNVRKIWQPNTKTKLTSIKCVINPQHNTPEKTVAMAMLTQKKNFTSVHQSSNRILICNKNFWGIYAKNYNTWG